MCPFQSNLLTLICFTISASEKVFFPSKFKKAGISRFKVRRWMLHNTKAVKSLCGVIDKELGSNLGWFQRSSVQIPAIT
jgi:hypothetical protein